MMNKLYIIIDHINGEIENLYVINGYDFAFYCSKTLGYIVYELDLSTLEVKEIKLWFMFQIWILTLVITFIQAT